MGKTMSSRTMGGRNPRVTMAIAALAVVLVVLTLIVAARTASTSSDSAADYAKHAMSAEDGTGGRSVNYDPNIDRHAEVVARYHEDSLR